MVVTRFAPSPTGYLHIGGLRTALFNYLYARANGGKFLLRIEDTDFNRNSMAATEAIIEAFSWVGLKYDNDEVIYQSKRLEIYKRYIDILLQNGKAYYCYTSKEELEELREAQRARGETTKYDNRYRYFEGTPPSGINPVVRIKAPLSGSVKFHDMLKGDIEINAKDMDDYIIARSDGTPTYNFVVAIDDALMGVSDVIRGDDHLTNTPKQIIVYEALGFKIPRFCHIPMILNEEGRKLSKRDGALNVMEYKDMGYLPQALLNFLLRLGFSYGDKEIFSFKEMIEFFNLKNLSQSPSAYNTTKLEWLNNHYLRELSSDEAESLLNMSLSLSMIQKNVLFKEVLIRSNTLLECREKIQEIINPPLKFDPKMISKVESNISSKILELVLGLDFTSVESISTSIDSFAKSCEIKAGKFLSVLRLALLGKSGGIGIAEVLFIIGKDDAKNRVEKLLSLFND